MRKYVGLLPVIVAVVVGCSSTARSRLAHWFFEIPDETIALQADAEPGTKPPVARLHELELPPAKYRSVHPPYAKQLCSNCHDGSERMQIRDDLLDACRTCHTRYLGKEVRHTPVAGGECFICHDPHRSTQPSLLRQPVFDTCVDCHDEPEDLSEAHHQGEHVENCTACHDPHFGGDFLLREQVQRSTAAKKSP